MRICRQSGVAVSAFPRTTTSALADRRGRGLPAPLTWRGAYSDVNSVSCIPSGAWTRALRSPYGVMTGGATRPAPAATSRAAISSLSATLTANRTVPDTRRPASIASTDSAWA